MEDDIEDAHKGTKNGQKHILKPDENLELNVQANEQ